VISPVRLSPRCVAYLSLRNLRGLFKINVLIVSNLKKTDLGEFLLACFDFQAFLVEKDHMTSWNPYTMC